LCRDLYDAVHINHYSLPVNSRGASDVRSSTISGFRSV
jgi:hypothetical protein